MTEAAPRRRNIHPADELADIRAAIARLKAREAALRAAFLRDPVAPLSGAEYEVVIRRQARRVFLRERLPPAILARPDLWETRHAQQITLRKRRASRVPDRAPDEDFEPFEPF